LSSGQAREVWRAMESLDSNRAPANMPGALVRDATMFNRYPECRKLIGEKASQDFLPGAIHGKAGHHPSEEETAHIPLDPVLMAHDTTCVDAIDHDGLMFFGDALRRVASERGCGRYRYSAQRTRAEFCADQRQPERT